MKRTPRDDTALRIAAMTGLTYRQVWRMAREGRIPGTIVGRRLILTPAQFDQLDRDGVKPAPATEKQPTFLYTRTERTA